MAERNYLDPEPGVPLNDSWTAKSVPWTWVGFGVCVLAAAVFIPKLAPERIEQLPPREAESAQEKSQKVAKVFSSEDAPERDPRHQELITTIEQLRAALENKDPTELDGLFDLERMLQEILRLEEAIQTPLRSWRPPCRDSAAMRRRGA